MASNAQWDEPHLEFEIADLAREATNDLLVCVALLFVPKQIA